MILRSENNVSKYPQKQKKGLFSSWKLIPFFVRFQLKRHSLTEAVFEIETYKMLKNSIWYISK